jgi:hypothetical protein
LRGRAKRRGCFPNHPNALRFPILSGSEYSAALSHWAGWAARLRHSAPYESSPRITELLHLVGWNAAKQLIEGRSRLSHKPAFRSGQWAIVSAFVGNCRKVSQSEAAHLYRIYEASKRRLFPLSDPLDVRFHLHRQLSASREEVYSDWLQWVLTQIAGFDAQLIGQILGSSRWRRFVNPHDALAVNREVPVAHGHEGQTGRMDLVISRGDLWLAVIEVKTRSYSNADMAKHKGYGASIPGSSLSAERIFISVDPPGVDSGDFRFLSWSDICVAIRRTAPALLTAGDALTTAMILAFVGAVEQNLLGFRSPDVPEMSIVRVPRMVEHLTRATREEVGLAGA